MKKIIRAILTLFQSAETPMPKWHPLPMRIPMSTPTSKIPILTSDDDRRYLFQVGEPSGTEDTDIMVSTTSHQNRTIYFGWGGGSSSSRSTQQNFTSRQEVTRNNDVIMGPQSQRRNGSVKACLKKGSRAKFSKKQLKQTAIDGGAGFDATKD